MECYVLSNEVRKHVTMAMVIHLHWSWIIRGKCSQGCHIWIMNTFQLDLKCFELPPPPTPFFPNLCQKHCVQCTVLLTKLHDSSVSQLGIIIVWPVGVEVWASPKGCSMYPVFLQSERSNSMSPPWLCAFRKSELERGKTTQSMVHSILMLSVPCTVYM